jgi:ferrous-iron efflux pump FieF
MRWATYAAVVVASLLIIAKMSAWLGTGSVALLSTLIDSTLDLAASGLNLLAVRHALQPADHEHRFGHGKAEPLAGLAQSTFIIGSGLLVLGEGAHRLIDPQPVTNGEGGIAVMVFSIVLTIGLVLFQRRVITKTGSMAINADALHYTGDLAMNVSVIIALTLTHWLGWTFIDPLCGLAIALFIMWGAGHIAWESFKVLMDQELPDDQRQAIKEICRANPQVRNVHDLRTRSSGVTSFIQLHLELDGELSLRQAHAIADEVEANIQAAFPNAEVIIHQDPAGIAEPKPVFD